MDDLIKLVKTYRFSSGVAERSHLAEEVCRLIYPDLSFFVFGLIPTTEGNDVLQNTIRSIVAGLKKFDGDSSKQFWAWCYCIARNKIHDHFREKATDRLHLVPTEELNRMMDTRAHDLQMTLGVRQDLDYVLSLLTASKPECYEFLWQHYVFGLSYSEIAAERAMTYDNARMKIGRCMEEARKLVA